tara:strand:- start:35 stop:574 length:540 start_codon:yes stop_codon:yes gene_type:complete
MKAKSIILFLILLTGSTYFVLDRHLFFYGKSTFSFYELLPENIKPENQPEFGRGFVLRDEHGMSLAGNEVKYGDAHSKIEEVIKYGFNSDLLIAEIRNDKDEIYFREFGKNQNPASKADISSRLIYEYEIAALGKLKWVEINDKKNYRPMVVARGLLALTLIGLFITLTVLTISKKNVE